jgi:hypothetical protein
VTDPDDDQREATQDGATPQLSHQSRRFYSRRAFWHSAGILLALAVAWLVFRAYRQPDFLLDLANMQLC